MAHLIDRRLNQKDKSLGNRRRFVRRVRSAVKEAVDKTVRRRGIADVDREKKVSIPQDGISEPTFRPAAEGGRRERVFTGNKQFRAGDRIEKPKGGQGGSGKQGADDGDGADDFRFVLSRDEFLDIFFEDLELPDLVKRTLKNTDAWKPRRAGYTVAGTPASLNVRRTMLNAHGRRIALRRPKSEEVFALQERIFELEGIPKRTGEEQTELLALRGRLEKALRRQKAIPYIDPLDVRYNNFQRQPEPAANAVMFCLMDVSASMGEREKDLAKRFFVLLHLFLKRRYDRIDLIFVRHSHNAREVDEEAFFHSRDTGGTIVSSGLKEIKKIIDARYSPEDWNIYVAQASDGENYSGDSQNCAKLLNNELMRLVQYFAYIEIVDEAEAPLLTSEASGLELWRAYRKVAATWPNFAMKRIANPGDIYPVFRELFEKKGEREHAA